MCVYMCIYIYIFQASSFPTYEPNLSLMLLRLLDRSAPMQTQPEIASTPRPELILRNTVSEGILLCN